jgi:hypothetical protein
LIVIGKNQTKMARYDPGVLLQMLRGGQTPSIPQPTAVRSEPTPTFGSSSRVLPPSATAGVPIALQQQPQSNPAGVDDLAGMTADGLKAVIGDLRRRLMNQRDLSQELFSRGVPGDEQRSVAAEVLADKQALEEQLDRERSFRSEAESKLRTLSEQRDQVRAISGLFDFYSLTIV